MLKRINRISKKKEFDAVFINNRSSFNKLLGVKLIKKTEAGLRFGIIVNLKVSKKACSRNLIKRRLRYILEDYIGCLKLNADVVIIVLPEALNASFNDLKQALLFSLKKVGLE